MRKDISSLFLFLFLFILAINFSSAVVDSEQVFFYKQNDAVNLTQTCSNCTFINITKITYPDSSQALGNVGMTKQGTLYNYSFLNTSELGIYTVYCVGDPDGVINAADCGWTFTVNPTGTDITGIQSSLVIVALLIIFILGIIFFLLSFKIDNLVLKIFFICIGLIMLTSAILYSTVLLDKSLADIPEYIDGFSTFWFVIKTLIGLTMTGFLIFVGFILWRSWQIKRGFRDD